MNQQQNQYTSINIEPQQSTSNGPSSYNYAQDDKKIQNLKAQVNEVSSIMEENIKRIVERGTRLENIENRSDLMSSRADEFRIQAKRVKNKAWWSNQRMNLLYLVILIGIGVAVYFTFFY